MYRIIIYGIKPEDVQPILEEQVGQGGFQTLLRKIRGQYSEQKEELCLYQDDIERIYRYAYEYGRGGFQDRIQKVIERLNMVRGDLAKVLNK